MEYYSCPMIEQMFLTFNGRIDTSEKPVTLCCENIEDIPRFSLAETPEETLKNFLAGRDFIIAEGKKLASSPDSHNGLLIRGGGYTPPAAESASATRRRSGYLTA